MLVLRRKIGQWTLVGDARVKVVAVCGETITLGFEAPREVPIVRGEVLAAGTIRQEQAGHAAAGSGHVVQSVGLQEPAIGACGEGGLVHGPSQIEQPLPITGIVADTVDHVHDAEDRAEDQLPLVGDAGDAPRLQDAAEEVEPLPHIGPGSAGVNE